MAKNINGSGFRLYFPNAEEPSIDSPPQPTPPLDSTSATPSIAAKKQPRLKTDNGRPGEKESPGGEVVALKSPTWLSDPAVSPQAMSGDTATEAEKLSLEEKRANVPIQLLEAAQLSEPVQEPNIRSYLDSRRRSSQLAEARRHSSVIKD
ncbi:hypothetical protein BR93DRAFT_933396 [Coniochaeta sp. PMI_546]|nr:hypothetical protein BR93DRAFT_933396 [Coniochaeta sp. PMI_546]